MIHKLRQKFILIAVASVTLVLVLMGLSINALNFLTTDRQLADSLVMICENQGTMPQPPRPDKPGEWRGGRFSPEAPFSTRYFVLDYTADGTLVDSDLGHIAAITQDDVGAYLDVALAHGEGFGYTGRYKYYVSHAQDGRHTAIFLDCSNELRALENFAAISAATVVVCVLLVLGLVVLLSKRAMTPIAVNMEKQKQFITDASHELKTPLTVIATSLKVLEMERGSSKWIDKMRGQTEKLVRLVNDMVSLSRLDEEKPPLQMRQFDVSAAAQEVLDSFREVAADRGHPLREEIAPGVRYCGDERAVRQLLSILLDNAVKYTDEGGEICLSLERGRRGILLKTTNPCTQMNAAEMEKLFDRFYRVDKTRSGQIGGFGIGLSIAQGIAKAHSGDIQASCPQPGVIQFAAALR